MLLHSFSEKAQALVRLILYRPQNIKIVEAENDQIVLKLEIRKIYLKSALVNGKPILESVMGNNIRKRLNELKKEYFLFIPNTT
ncbi:hypothetical protein [Bacillus sp. FSL K6-3431]|uniref:hypothetical protein n=1 Tax=Bacillus sp. FSL K6-3431 TaxID=2921500 RepID=UPI0030F8FA8B